jgi:hypothetical protein
MSPLADVSLGVPRNVDVWRACGLHSRCVGPCIYRFPPLAECRKRFEELMQSSIDWNSRKIKGLPYLSDLPTCFGKFARKSRDSETHPRGQTNIFLQLL